MVRRIRYRCDGAGFQKLSGSSFMAVFTVRGMRGASCPAVGMEKHGRIIYFDRDKLGAGSGTGFATMGLWDFIRGGGFSWCDIRIWTVCQRGLTASAESYMASYLQAAGKRPSLRSSSILRRRRRFCCNLPYSCRKALLSRTRPVIMDRKRPSRGGGSTHTPCSTVLLCRKLKLWMGLLFLPVGR